MDTDIADSSFTLITNGGNINYYKSANHPIPTLSMRTSSTLAIFKISKLWFQLRFRIYYLLAQIEEERPFLEGRKKGDHIVRLSPRALGCHKRWKSLSFCEIWNNPTPPLFFIRPPHKKALQDMEFYDKLVDRFQDLSKVKNPAVSKGKV